MAKKNKKNRGSERPSATSRPPEASKPAETVAAVEAKKVEVAPPAVKPEEKREEKKDDKREEAASNVIQFPAQAKRTVSQVAVNDDVVPGRDEEEPSGDDTQPRLKTDEADKPKAEAKTETKSERPAAPKSEPPAASDDDEDETPKSREERKEKRKKKAAMTESGEMRALGTGDHAVVTEEFFTTKKKSTPVEHDDFADLQRSLEPMSPERKQAMWATAGIVLVGLVAIGSYYYYQNYHMPQPVQLGRAGPVEMPQLATSTTPPATTEATPPATTEAAPPATAEATPPATTEVPPATTEVVPPTTAEVAPPATTEVVPPTTAEVAPPATTEVAPPATTETAPAETYESVLAQAVAARGASRQMPLLQRAIELNPNGADALARLSYIYIQRPGRANMEQARSLAERATAADPTNAQGWLVLGAARSELGDRAGARAAFDSCVAQGTGRYVAECRASR
jgi:cytochrome c-type biogenesis protein CcmH/NrfG